MKRKILAILAAGTLAALAAHVPSQAPLAKGASDHQFEVLNPWAEVDPIPLRGISPRIESLAGKKIGLFANYKRAARPMQVEVAKQLKERYPDIETVLFDSRDPNVTETETKNRDRFIAWAKEVDAVIAAVGD
jgi:hypothetical protein